MMQSKYVKGMIAVAWVLIVAAAGLTSSLMSAYAWAFVALVAVLPPYLMMRFWNDPPQTISESIRAITR